MERIHVAVRARPLSAEDAKSTPWRISGSSIFIPNYSNKFEFDRVFGEACKTEEVYRSKTKEIVTAAVRGFNGTVFAYGQTNSGKTHTMRGTSNEPGVIPLAVHDLFHIIQQDVDREFLLRMSYMEIYNEDINDLLAPEHRKLQIHESTERGIYVAGLREEIVASPQQVLDLMQFGESHRHIGETNMNLYSSRSHTIFRMIIESRDRTGDEDSSNSCDAVRVSVLNLVDLAGSERAAKTGAEGVRLKEGSHINKSLMTLGTVIKKLSEGAESQGGHVPYRDSKLTRILQPALGGNANTAIICNITLAQIHADETKSSLLFASRALRVTNCAHVNEVDPNIQPRASAIKPMKDRSDMGPLLPFQELVSEIEVGDDVNMQSEDCKNNASEDCTLPDPCSLLHVTNRRKAPPRKKGSTAEDHEWAEIQVEYEDLLQKLETQRTTSEIQIDCLRRQLGETNFIQCVKCSNCLTSDGNTSTNNLDKNVSLRESEAIIVIKQLQDKIKMLEMEKSSSQQNLDSVVELATEQSICARETFEELHEELQNAREETRIAHEQLNIIDVSLEIEDIMSEVKNSKEVVESCSSLLDEVFQSFSSISNAISDFKALICQSSHEQGLIISSHEKLYHCMKQKVDEVENEKLLLHKESTGLQKQIQELRHNTQNYEESLRALTEHQNFEKEEFLSQIQNLQKELSCLSSCFLAKEKDNLRKDLEKTKVKLKETESKLKNAVQEKTKLEGQKTFAEREVKRLHGQKTLLERDISKRDSLAGRRRDSMVDRSSKMFDPKKSKGLAASFEETMEEDYRKLEVLAFEMEATIASLEEEVTAAHKEKEEAISRNESLASELEALTEKLNISNAEVNVLQEDASRLRLRLEESTLDQQKLENSIRLLAEQKEELAMQLSDSLLEMEEEKTIWFSKEKASIEVIEEKGAEITAMTKAMSEVRNELESCREECKVLTEKLACSEENAEREKKSSAEKSLEIDQLKNHLMRADIESKQSQETLKSNLDTLSLELDCARGKVNTLEKEMIILSKERDDLFTQIRGLDRRLEPENDFQCLQNQLLSITSERDKWIRHCDDMLLESKVQVEELNGRISSMEAKMKNEEAMNNKERAKFRMRLRGTQAKSDAFHFRYKEAVNELAFMNRNYEVASKKLKNQLASYGIEILNLKKQIAALTGQRTDH
ncbi:LOW QUALITY PROTEIN: kinesin-like protein KIN-7O [Populus nigra]|uniref:LOW QUALITY PROTEIN: kinesin-like protein KIN-7O n=1 Tax=Populus nigra TaxID=3691 RepID=UPI002B26DA0B|nr:LOW QUALITY PROTEIN: kinesin-like protein KIN-7O [Populus nigra]